MVDKFDPNKLDLSKIKLPENGDFKIDPDLFKEMRGKLGSLDLESTDYDPLANLPNGQIRYLMSRLSKRDQAGVAYQYEQFEQWQKNPKKARVDWLLPLYLERKWISGEEFINIKESVMRK